MHAAAREAVVRAVEDLDLARRSLRILDVGGRFVNGHVRDLFHPGSTWTVLDIEEAPEVNLVADVTSWEPDDAWDVVISTEALEHIEGWEKAVEAMASAVMPGGAIILTAAMDPRLPHSGVDGGGLRPGEWYQNVDPSTLAKILDASLGAEVSIEARYIEGHGGDVYAWGRKAR